MEIIISLIVLIILGSMFYFWHLEETAIPEQYIVKYPDGKISTPMSYKNALSYAGVFKGQIIKI